MTIEMKPGNTTHSPLLLREGIFGIFAKASLFRRRTPGNRFGLVCLAFICLLLICIGCSAKSIVHKPITLEPRAETQKDADEARTAESKAPGYEVLNLPVYEKDAPAKQLLPRESIDPKRFKHTNENILINAEKMPLSDFVIYALGETLKIAFIMDEATMNNKQLITFRMPQPMEPDKAFEIIISLLDKYGLYVEERAGALYILQKPPEPKAPIDVRVGRNTVDSPADILQIIPLRHIRPGEIDWLLKEMIKTGIQIKQYPKENVLLLHGRANQMKQVIEFVDTFDVPYIQNKKLFMIRLTYWQVEDFIIQINKILQGLGFNIATTPRDPGPLFLPIKYLNSILVVSPDDLTTKFILEWKDKLDTAESAGAEEKAYIYRPLYSRAEELVVSIKKLYGIMPAEKTAGIKSAPAAAQTGAMPADLRISADDSKNTIIIFSSPAVYKKLLVFLKGLDTPPKQVLIEATIAEVTLTDELKYGVEWYIKNRQNAGQYVLQTLGQLGFKPLGLTYSFISDAHDISAMISAFANDNRANILSTPRLTVLDNREAMIQIGEDIPTVTGEVTAADTTATAATPSILRNIVYRSTGVILKVKPTINTEGLLTLDISQEVSVPGASGIGDSPIILIRRINTSVVIAHGQTIALGGLIKENSGVSESKVPLLGDIPILGNLFKTTSTTKTKTELIVLVTPTILVTADDASRITDAMKKELKWFQ